VDEHRDVLNKRQQLAREHIDGPWVTVGLKHFLSYFELNKRHLLPGKHIGILLGRGYGWFKTFSQLFS